MKKLFIVLAVAGAFTACNNSANTTDNAKDSLDSVAKERKEMVDSTTKATTNALDSSANARKDMIDSTTKAKKEVLDSTKK